MAITRRHFIQTLGAASALSLGGAPFLSHGADRRIVIVGGGIGGATAARQLRLIDPATAVTLIEPKRQYYSCPMSNEVLSGRRAIGSIRFGYEGLKALGVEVIHDRVSQITPVQQTVTTEGGRKYVYTRCIVAPGIAFTWGRIEGLTTKTTGTIPHAWQAGPQTMTLQRQLREMPDGGVVIIAPPSGPMRAPHAPYERASQIAHWLKQHKPRSRVLLLDPKTVFPQQALFFQAWEQLFRYGGPNALIEWQGGPDNRIIRLDAASRTVTTASGDRHRGEVLNLIPGQQAGRIAGASGLTDASGWCPVDLHTFESTRHKGIHIIGDACIAGPMRKLGSAAHSQARACAAAVISLLDGKRPAPAVFTDVAYSVLNERYAFSAIGVYRWANGGETLRQVAGGATPENASPADLEREAAYAHSWFNNLTQDTFGQPPTIQLPHV